MENSWTEFETFTGPHVKVFLLLTNTRSSATAEGPRDELLVNLTLLIFVRCPSVTLGGMCAWRQPSTHHSCGHPKIADSQ